MTGISIKNVSKQAKVVISMFSRHLHVLNTWSHKVLNAIHTPPTPEMCMYCMYALSSPIIFFTDHFATPCSVCHEVAIRGERYQCRQCGDVNLCARCRGKNIHNEHNFVKYSTPFSGPEHSSSFGPSNLDSTLAYVMPDMVEVITSLVLKG